MENQPQGAGSLAENPYRNNRRVYDAVCNVFTVLVLVALAGLLIEAVGKVI